MRISVLTPSIRPQGLNMIRVGLLSQTFKDFEWLVELGLDKHDLNASYNRMLRRATGELVVSLQDYSLIPPDYLERWWTYFENNPSVFMTAPVGRSTEIVHPEDAHWDWRKERVGQKIAWNEWEIDNGAAPLKALKAIGGFDEALDGIWSGDNVNVGKRAQLAGHAFLCVDNPLIAYDHDATYPHPFRDTYNATLNTKRMVMFEGGLQLPPL